MSHAASSSSSSSLSSSKLQQQSPEFSSLQQRLLHYFLLLVRSLSHLIALLCSSDPARFLPARRRFKHHHHHHRASQQQIVAVVSEPQTPTTPSTPLTPLEPATPAPHSPGSTSISPSISPASSTSSTSPPAVSTQSTPPVPFLSPCSFPLPSSCLPGARFYYNLDEVAWPIKFFHHLMGKEETTNHRSSGQLRASNSADALNLLRHSSSSSISNSNTGSSGSSTPHKRKRWTLVLDLDETLVHTTSQPLADYDCRVEIHTRRAKRVFYILKRPYLDTFLTTLSSAYDIVIFTASVRRYADAVIDLIDTNRVVSRRYFRPSCIKSGINFIKDLRSIIHSSHDMRRTILVDNSPIAYSLQQENALPILTWLNDSNDTALRDLIPFLLALRSMDDVRPLLYRRHALGRSLELPETVESVDAATLAAQPQIPLTSKIIEEDEMATPDGSPSRSSSRNSNHSSNSRSSSRNSSGPDDVHEDDEVEEDEEEDEYVEETKDEVKSLKKKKKKKYTSSSSTSRSNHSTSNTTSRRR